MSASNSAANLIDEAGPNLVVPAPSLSEYVKPSSSFESEGDSDVLNSVRTDVQMHSNLLGIFGTTNECLMLLKDAGVLKESERGKQLQKQCVEITGTFAKWK